MNLRKRKLSSLISWCLTVMLVTTLVFPNEVALQLSEVFAQGAMTVGSSGSLSPGSPHTSISGIETAAFRIPPIRVSLYRDKKATLVDTSGLDAMFRKMYWGFPDNLTGSLHFMNPTAVATVGSRPISIARANTASKTLDYLADADAISNIIPLGGTTPQNGVYYGDIKSAGIDSYRQSWRSRATNYNSSVGAWTYILQNINGSYAVEHRMEEIFNPARLDYNNTVNWSKEQSDDVYMHYLDMLMSLYTVASGSTKEVWGHAIDDYLTSENLQESPISVCVDAESLMTFNGSAYFMLVPVIDFFNYYDGIERSFAINEVPWWTVATEAYWAPGDTYKQLQYATQASINNSPNFSRIASVYNKNNGFSFGATAYSKGVLRTAGNTAQWGPADNVLTDYLNIFKLSSPGNTAWSQFGYMLSPAPAATPTPTIGALKAEPDIKVVETQQLGIPVSLNVSAGVDAQDHGAWENIIKNAKATNSGFTATFTVTRTSPDVSNPLALPSNPARLTWTPDEMLEFVNGTKNYTVFDNTTTVPTAGKKTITFNYTVDIDIAIGNKNYTGQATDSASFSVLEPRIGYASKPEAYSELKNYGSGSNTTGTLSEDWEAMAGVPSTEQLYFAAGGSEFIVEVTVERIEDEVAKRTYQSNYGGIDCEFKDGDTAKPVNFPPQPGAIGASISGNPYWDPHAGGNFEFTWTGSVPNKAVPKITEGKGHVESTCVAIPDLDSYKAALTAAQNYVNTVNNTTFSWTAASDKKTRSKNQWGARISTNIKNEPENVTEDDDFFETNDKGKEKPVSGSVTADPSGPGDYTIKVTWSIPAHIIDGPDCSHVLPPIYDSWAQTFTYDSMKIADVHVWRIDQAAVDGLKKIISTDIVGAEVVKGQPNIFYNIALKNDPNYVKQDGSGGATGTSLAGRVRYDLDSPQHDTVVYNNGTRTNKCDGLSTTYPPNVIPAGGGGHSEGYSTGFIYNAFKPGSSTHGSTASYEGQLTYPTDTDNFLINKTDAKDKATVEYAKFLQQRQKQVRPTMITDFLILQTSAGDQAVMYYHQSAGSTVKAESKMPKMDVDNATMWDNNVNSAAKWEEDHINVGGYNGKYKKPESKFSVNNKGSVARTFLDPDPAGTIRRPTRPNTNLMLYTGELNIILADKNKSYTTGKAEVFWRNYFHWTDRSSPRFASVTDPLKSASFPTDMVVGAETDYNFANSSEVKIGDYSLGNGLNRRNNETIDNGGSAYTNTPEAGVYGPYIGVSKGRYKVDVYGSGLGNGRAVVYTEYGAVDWSSLVQYETRTDTHVTYYVDIPSATSMMEFCWHSNNTNSMRFDYESVTLVGYTDPNAKGYILEAPYSPSHEKINNLIVQDPVSTADISLVSLPAERDQRTGETLGGSSSLKDDINKTQVCPREPSLCDFRVLNCTFLKDTVIGDFDFNTVDSQGNPINKVTKNSLILPTGFSLSGGELQAYGTRLAIPFAELKLQYQTSTRVRVEADITMPTPTNSGSMIFSFQNYDIWVPQNWTNGVINTGIGDERKITKPIADGARHHLVVDFSFNTTDRTRVTVDGVEGYIRNQASKELSSQLIGDKLYIGSWGANNNYPAQFKMDNLKITRLAGTETHNEDCYKMITVHPNSLNAHQHSEGCLDGGNGSTGAQYIANSINNGTLNESQIRDILGPAYDPIMANSFGPVIHTWSNWTSSNMQGFSALKDCSIGANGNMVINSTGGDPIVAVPVDFIASGISKISVTLDNNTSANNAQLFWSRADGAQYSESTSVWASMQPNKANQVVNFVVRNSAQWKDLITGLRFDLTDRSGQVVVRNIQIYGSGNKTSNGSSNERVVWSSGSPGLSTYTAPAGNYRVETWGAQGGIGTKKAAKGGTGGLGGYSTGNITLNSAEALYIYVGGQDGWNGGGTSTVGSNGGGASDIRRGGQNIGNRIIVAGGGGGGGNGATGGYGGGYYGSSGTDTSEVNGGSYGTPIGGYGLGVGQSIVNDAAAGGGGYYGGYAATAHSCNKADGGGGGGSGYIGGVSDGNMLSGGSSMPSPYGGTEVGHAGNGYARILSLFSPVKIVGKGNVGTYPGQVIDYGFTGSTQSMSLTPGTYRLETWGAQGGAGYTGYEDGGRGGYSSGYVNISSNQNIYVNVGGKGGQATNTGNGTQASGGWNGGSWAWDRGAGGGGGTDFRLGNNNYGNTIIAAGGGGGTYSTDIYGGSGGGNVGEGGEKVSGSGRMDNGGGAGAATGSLGTAFGPEDTRVWGSGGGGGGGYWGGRSGGKYNNNNYYGGGGGGSGYTGGVYSASTVVGSGSIPNPNGGAMLGNSGNGYARLTVVSVSSAQNTPIVSVADIKKYWNIIPDKLGNGADNPIWGCGRPFNIHVHDSACKDVSTLVCDEPHHKGMHYDVSNDICWDPCENDENHKQYKPTINAADGNFTPGNFVNLDYAFRIYFPNEGDFDEGEPHGIGSLTSSRGMGFTDGLDTTKWTRVKRIRFEYNVIYKDVLYKSGEWIVLGDRGKYTGKNGSKYAENKWSNYGKEIFNDIDKEYYDFYCVLANYEAKSAAIDVEVEAVNCPGPNDNLNEITNRHRGKYSSLHGGSNTTYADVVGRIGNVTIEDTGDFRFSNLFKTPLQNTTAPVATDYKVGSGLSATNGASVSGNKVVTNGVGNSATVGGVFVKKGSYRIDVAGQALNNGRLKVMASEDWSGDNFVKNVVLTTSKMSFYLSVPSDEYVDISWIANNSTNMEVSGVTLTRLGDSTESWALDGIVRDVDESNQNYYMTWSKDIRGLPISKETNYINTYNALNWVDSNRIQMPLSAEKNNIDILKDEPLLVGYPLYFDISTLGNYWWNNSSKIQAVPYYYALDINKKQIIPVDAYFKYDNEYKPVNINGLVTPTWDGSGVYNYVLALDWLGESVRRNYTDIEKRHTDFFRDFYAEGKINTTPTGTSEAGDASQSVAITPKQLDGPSGSSYVLGNGQKIEATGKARTFIGGETTYGKLMNLGGANKISKDEDGRLYNEQGRMEDYLWWQSAQRWHLKIGLPSSTTFIRTGQKPNSTNIKEFDNSNYVILCTADIRVIGDTYILKYNQDSDNGSINIQKTDGTWAGSMKLPNNIPPVLAVYSTTKSSTYDVDIVANH